MFDDLWQFFSFSERPDKSGGKAYHPSQKASRPIQFHDTSREEDSENSFESMVIKCKSCGARNRIKRHPRDEIPVCGRCGTALEEPRSGQDVNDAFTGEPIDFCREVLQCRKCKVYYHKSSVDVLAAENGGRCVSCSSTHIAKVPGRPAGKKAEAGRARRAGRESTGESKEKASPPPEKVAPFSHLKVTIDTYRDRMGKMVTFEGQVKGVTLSSDGKAYGVMFENKPWMQGLKMLVLRNYLPLVGGAEFLKSLEGRVIRINGLLTSHPFYGDEILVTDRNMILEIR